MSTTHAATGPRRCRSGELGGGASSPVSAGDVDGLYVATATAGRAESVEFWRAALETGLAFANPRLFPWTLANSPTGAIAKALDVRGPTYTLVGGDDAIAGALEHAADDLAAGIVTAALVVVVDVVDGAQRYRPPPSECFLLTECQLSIPPAGNTPTGSR